MLADPTRRHILDLLAARGPLSVGQIASEFPHLVPSGISKHLAALRATGLVTVERRGRVRLYTIDAQVVAESLAPWVALYERYWPAALQRLKTLSEQPEPTR